MRLFYLKYLVITSFIPLCLSISCEKKSISRESDPSYIEIVTSLAEQAKRVINVTVPDEKSFSAAINTAVADIKKQIDKSKHPHEIVGTFIDQIYKKWAVGFDTNRADIAALFPQTVIERQNGSCLGVAFLFLILAEELDLPFHGVLLPTHFFVRYDDSSTQINLEPNRKGYHYTDEQYRKKYGVPDSSWYDLRNLPKNEAVACFKFNIANIYRQKSHPEQAVKLYKDVLADLPGYAEAYGNLGITYDMIGQTSQAVKALKQAKLLNPHLTNISRNLGTMLLKIQEFDEAIGEYSQALKKNPDNPDLHYGLGLGYYYKGEYEKTAQSLKQAVELRPDFSEAKKLLEKLH